MDERRTVRGGDVDGPDLALGDRLERTRRGRAAAEASGQRGSSSRPADTARGTPLWNAAVGRGGNRAVAAPGEKSIDILARNRTIEGRDQLAARRRSRHRGNGRSRQRCACASAASCSTSMVRKVPPSRLKTPTNRIRFSVSQSCRNASRMGQFPSLWAARDRERHRDRSPTAIAGGIERLAAELHAPVGG